MSARGLRTLRRHVAACALGALGALALAGCTDRASFRGVALEPPDPAPALRVADANGSPFDLAEQRGHVVLLFFGYSHCPDVCPTTLADWVRVREALGEDAEQVRFVFVSVDPARDTPEVAMGYARTFHPSFIGLSPDAASLPAVLRDFHLAAHEEPPAEEGLPYTVAHGSHVVVVDREGMIRVLHPYGSTVDDVVADVRRLVD